MDQALSAAQTVERRTKPRLNCSFPAIVQGIDLAGKKFRGAAQLTNLSAAGLCLVLNSTNPPGKDLFVLFRCSATGPLGKGKAPLIAVHGEVVRLSEIEPGKYNLAVKIQHNRFL